MSANSSALAWNDASSAVERGQQRGSSPRPARRGARRSGRRRSTTAPCSRGRSACAPLAGEVRDDLVGVHVRRGARPGLEDVDRELVVVLAARRPRRRRRRCARRRRASSRPSSAFTRAAAPLMRPSQRTTDTGTRSPEIGKLSTAFVVSPPQSCSVVAMKFTACSPKFRARSAFLTQDMTMHASPLTRRALLRSGALAAGALAFGPGFYRSRLRRRARDARPGPVRRARRAPTPTASRCRRASRRA